MGRDLRRSGGGYRTAGPTAASCRGDPDQGLQLSAARTHRPGAVACANPRRHRAAASAETAWPSTQTAERLITAKKEKNSFIKLGNFREHV